MTGRPTAAQVRATRAVVAWYFRTYFDSPDDPGTLAMFSDPLRVGTFAVSAADLMSADEDALNRLLVACTLFQRQRDTIVMRILRSVSLEQVAALTARQHLDAAIDACICPHQRSLAALNEFCDVGKDPVNGRGCCSANPDVPCHLKEHAVQLRRYGDFGKVPTSLALLLREEKVRGLHHLYQATCEATEGRVERSRLLEAAIVRVWRVSRKIASMFLSLVANPALSPAPWQHGLDWTQFVVIDSNVDLFLASLGVPPTRGYDERRQFIQDLARHIDLTPLNATVDAYNPRLVQQAMYLFMSTSNRGASQRDCSLEAPSSCRRCPASLKRRCYLRPA